MKKILNYLLTTILLFAALSLIIMSLIIMGWSVIEVVSAFLIVGLGIYQKLSSSVEKLSTS